LKVSVERLMSAPPTNLSARGAYFGIPIRPQIEDLKCDGQSLRPETRPGSWRVPAGCRHVTWRIALDQPGKGDASMQRSIGSATGAFTLISEASSLARFADAAEPELLAVPKADIGGTLPHPMPDGTIALPKDSAPPLFVLLGSRPIAERSAGNVHLAYFVDDPTQAGQIPAIDTTLRGLVWLASLAPASRNTNFADVWLRLSASAKSVGGSTGDGMTLVNYIPGTAKDSLKAAAMAAAPLIEATHQLGLSYGIRPRWAEESLATYFGFSALQHALPDQTAPKEKMEQACAEASRFPFGLIEAHRRVARGDPSAYGAFFTKGVAFWSSVDEAMRKAGVRGGLGSRLPRIWTAAYDQDGRPPADFAKLLGLPAAKWRELNNRYLGT
jgi:hypothetical protein